MYMYTTYQGTVKDFSKSVKIMLLNLGTEIDISPKKEVAWKRARRDWLPEAGLGCPQTSLKRSRARWWGSAASRLKPTEPGVYFDKATIFS